MLPSCISKKCIFSNSAEAAPGDLVWVTPCVQVVAQPTLPLSSMFRSAPTAHWHRRSSVADPRICQHLRPLRVSQPLVVDAELQEVGLHRTSSALLCGVCSAADQTRDEGNITGFQLGKHFPEYQNTHL